ncbi:MAG: UDP-4-amino-4,6-dideoxy-N-acetyl-beta-L-altrosamine transaminase [Thermodesulfovibrionales bacterium]|nr:UDP-4-amino-4,6-dideoxy-N-acetyl-beta-L-altrosamine transaminase [Thermodesulfovibrionales bacterium]
MSLIPYGRQWIDEEDIRAVVDVLTSDYLTQGPKIVELETALAQYCGSTHAVVFSSGTAALHAAYFAAGIGEGDEIITSPVTFAATANAAIYLGASPAFVDVEPDTGNINPKLVEGAITKRTKAIVPVHFAGHPADLDPIHDIAERHGLLVIEDACHALGASYRGKKAGSISDMTAFSFHPVKPITTGEGGAVLTNSPVFYERLLMFRTHGITKDASRFENTPHGDWYYEMHSLGYNYRMTDIQAALGLSQLRKLDAFTARRREIAKRYSDAFSESACFDIPVEREYARSCWHLYPIRLKNPCAERKRELFGKLRQRGMGVQVHYMPVYLHPYYRRLGYGEGLCPEAEGFYRRELSIPIYPLMADEDVSRVVSVMAELAEEMK